MSNEIKADYIPNGTLDQYIKTVAGLHWYPAGQVFESWGGGAGRVASDYAVAMTGDASGSFVGDFDTNIPAGEYWVTVKIRAGVDAAADDDVHGNGSLFWNGTSEETESEFELNAYDPPTYAETSELLGIAVGSGSVVVTDSYGGGDYKYETTEGAGIDNAWVYVYLKSDYNAGRVSLPYIVAKTNTTVTGGWATSLNLDPATYILHYFRQGSYGPDTAELVVTEE